MPIRNWTLDVWKLAYKRLMGNCDPVRKGHEADAGCAFLVTINFKDHVERLFPYFIRTCAMREGTTGLTFQLFDNLFYGIVVASVAELI